MTPRRFSDERGCFSETYSAATLVRAGFTRPFVQDNRAVSARRGTLRGLHFQAPPKAQDKLLRVARGATFDVAVDIRRGSPTYGCSVSMELSEENGRQLLITRGFAHGYLTLTDRADLLYKVTSGYAPECESGLRWDDPAHVIPLPLELDKIAVNARDGRWPTLSDLERPFEWQTN